MANPVPIPKGQSFNKIVSTIQRNSVIRAKKLGLNKPVKQKVQKLPVQKQSNVIPLPPMGMPNPPAKR